MFLKRFSAFKHFLFISVMLCWLNLFATGICAAVSPMDSSGFVVLTDIVPEAIMEML